MGDLWHGDDSCWCSHTRGHVQKVIKRLLLLPRQSTADDGGPSSVLILRLASDIYGLVASAITRTHWAERERHLSTDRTAFL